MNDVTDLTEQVLRTWDREGLLVGGGAVAWQRLAIAAVSTLTGCPGTHPDRPDVRCTQDRHETGHIYHRNSDLGLEWWIHDGVTYTVHDVLGPVRIGGGTKAGTREQPGRYHTLPPCEDDDPEDQPQARTDRRLCGVGHADYSEWRCDRPAGHKTVGYSEYHADSKHGTTWSDEVAVWHHTDAGTDPDTDVYRSLVPILETVAGFLDRMGRRYRDGNPRMTSELCRTAETHRDALDTAAGSLRDLTDPTTEADSDE